LGSLSSKFSTVSPMGCGASAGSQIAVSLSPIGASDRWLESKFGGAGRTADLITNNIVLASATRPDWNTTDYLVFELSADDEGVFELTGKLAVEKSGRFYSKRQESVGTWRIIGNVLTLVWPLSLKTDTVIAVKTPRKWINHKSHLSLEVLQPIGENPYWFTPEVCSDKFKAVAVSGEQFECPVCFFELYKYPSGVIRLHSRRSCCHYMHYECAQYLLKSAKGSSKHGICPLCGADFAEVKPMPSLASEPREWFSTVDLDYGGELDQVEVIEALGCVLPLDRHKLDKHVKAHWHEWDPDGDGTITLHEFCLPQRGLRDWIMGNVTLLKADHPPLPIDVPVLDMQPREWFQFWDRNANGTLERDELVRALIRTFCTNENGQTSLPQAHDMREVAMGLWVAVGHEPFDMVTFEEFIKPYGLMDQFLHNQTHCAYFGMDDAG